MAEGKRRGRPPYEYDLYQHGEYIGRYFAQELVTMLGVSRAVIKDDCVIIEPTQKDLENQGFVAGSICF